MLVDLESWKGLVSKDLIEDNKLSEYITYHGIVQGEKKNNLLNF